MAYNEYFPGVPIVNGPINQGMLSHYLQRRLQFRDRERQHRLGDAARMMNEPKERLNQFHSPRPSLMTIPNSHRSRRAGPHRPLGHMSATMTSGGVQDFWKRNRRLPGALGSPGRPLGDLPSDGSQGPGAPTPPAPQPAEVPGPAGSPQGTRPEERCPDGSAPPCKKKNRPSSPTLDQGYEPAGSKSPGKGVGSQAGGGGPAGGAGGGGGAST